MEDNIRRVANPLLLSGGGDGATGQWWAGDAPEEIRVAFSRFTDVVSCDIETTITGSVLTADVVCVGVSDGFRTVVIDPWVPAVHASILTEFFKNKTVVGHNFLNFDMLALQRDGVVFERVPEDTLLAHHAYASHLPQKLDQVVSEYCDARPWKIVFGRRGGNVASEKGGLPPHKMPAAERDFYCACDCVLTIQSWHRMQADLEPERAIYEHDKRLAGLCQRMQVGGIGVDVEGQVELSLKLKRRKARLRLKMRRLLRWPDFNPRRPANVTRALYTRLRARVLQRTKTGLPATSEAVLEAFARGDSRVGRFSRDLMTYRLVDKIKGTYCNPPEAPVWMADGTFKRLGDIKVGDEVMGWDLGTPGAALPIGRRGSGKGVKKRKLVAAKVTAVGRRHAPIVRVHLASGNTIRCTPDHLWLRGGSYNKRHPWLTRLSPGCGRSLARFVNVPAPCPDADIARWLGGLFDGEGCVTKRRLDIAQSWVHNPDVYNEVFRAFHVLGLPIKVTYGGAHNGVAHFRVQGRQDTVNFLNWCRPIRHKKIAEALRAAVSWKPDRIVSVEPDRPGEVISLTTSTGNYVAWGYGSKNCDPIPVLSDGRAHYNWKAFGTVSGRLAGRLQSCPRPGPLPEQKVRALYIATGKLQTARLVAQVHDAAIFEVGYELVYFDLAQAEARLAAYLSGDPELIKAVESDIHTANAKLLFTGKPGSEDGRFDRRYAADGHTKLKDLFWEQGGFKKERDVTKNAGFCVWYVGAADKVYVTLTNKGFPVTLRHCQIFYDRAHDKYWRYYRYVEKNLEAVRKTGYMRTAQLGRYRWLGFWAAITDVANFPIQAGIADVMNERLMEIEEKAARMTCGDDVEALIRETWSRAVVLRKGPIVDSDREFVLPADVKRARSWGDL